MPVISATLMTLRLPSLRRDDLNDDVDRRSNLAADGGVGNIQAGHGHHGFQAAQSVARGVGVNRGERAVVARVHGLQHVERFLAADLADDDAVGAHTQRVDHQLPLVDRALAFDVGRARFQPNDVFLVELQFGRVFNRHDAFAIGNVGRQHVQETSFFRRRYRRKSKYSGGPSRIRQASSSIGAVKVLICDQIVRHQAIAAETPDGEAGPVHGQRRNNGVHARAVGQTRVHHRRRFIDPAANGGNDAVDDGHQVRIVAELNSGGLQHAARARRRHALVGVHQNIGNGRIGKQRLERAESEYFVENFLREAFPLLQIHRSGFADYQAFQNLRHFAADVFSLDFVQAIKIQFLDQLAVNRGLHRIEIGSR